MAERGDGPRRPRSYQDDLTVPGHPDIYVLGDTASLERDGKPIPGVAQVAINKATMLGIASLKACLVSHPPSRPVLIRHLFAPKRRMRGDLWQKWSHREVPRQSDWVCRTACLPRSPEALGLNPSRTIGALAERAADLIAKEGR